MPGLLDRLMQMQMARQTGGSVLNAQSEPAGPLAESKPTQAGRYPGAEQSPLGMMGAGIGGFFDARAAEAKQQSNIDRAQGMANLEQEQRTAYIKAVTEEQNPEKQLQMHRQAMAIPGLQEVAAGFIDRMDARAVARATAASKGSKKDFEIESGPDGIQWKVYHDGRPPELAIPNQKPAEMKPSSKLAYGKHVTTQLEEFNTIGNAAEQALALLNVGGGPGEVGALIKYAKMLDPPSVVREGEVALQREAGGHVANIQNFVEKFSVEGSVIGDAQREGIRRSIKALANIAERRYNIRREYFTKFLGDVGMQPGTWMPPKAVFPEASTYSSGVKTTPLDKTGGVYPPDRKLIDDTDKMLQGQGY